VTGVGQQDVVDLLLTQHNEIRDLLSELRMAQGDRKRELFEQLVRLLAVHESAEEGVVHPVARRTIIHGEEVVEHRLEEENVAKRDLAELYDMGVDHPEFDSRLARLADEVLTHATREENEEFRRLREDVPEERLQKMAGALKAAEAVAPTRPHPKTGESAVATMLTGPPMAVFDRVRDAVRDWRQSHPD
jgi:hemerythrin superfamily protein